jgi:hypothetical protein
MVLKNKWIFCASIGAYIPMFSQGCGCQCYLGTGSVSCTQLDMKHVPRKNCRGLVLFLCLSSLLLLSPTPTHSLIHTQCLASSLATYLSFLILIAIDRCMHVSPLPPVSLRPSQYHSAQSCCFWFLLRRALLLLTICLLQAHCIPNTSHALLH